MSEKRVTVGILDSKHKRLEVLAQRMPSNISKLVDKAIEDFLERREAIYLRAADEADDAAGLTTPPQRMTPRHIPKKKK